jgi:hypothetical protein
MSKSGDVRVCYSFAQGVEATGHQPSSFPIHKQEPIIRRKEKQDTGVVTVSRSVYDVQNPFFVQDPSVHSSETGQI